MWYGTSERDEVLIKVPISSIKRIHSNLLNRGGRTFVYLKSSHRKKRKTSERNCWKTIDENSRTYKEDKPSSFYDKEGTIT